MELPQQLLFLVLMWSRRRRLPTLHYTPCPFPEWDQTVEPFFVRKFGLEKLQVVQEEEEVEAD